MLKSIFSTPGNAVNAARSTGKSSALRLAIDKMAVLLGMVIFYRALWQMFCRLAIGPRVAL
jgi:hypothetical protein